MRSHMFQHVRCRLKGRLTNLVHADRVPAVITCHESAARNASGRYVHVLSLRFNSGLPGALVQQPQTLVTANYDRVLRVGSPSRDVRCCQAAAPIVATQSDSLRIFFRARFRARACFTLRLSPGFR